MRKGGRVAGVVQLPKHLVVGENLSGVVAAQAKQLAQKRGLVDPAEQEDVAPGDCSPDVRDEPEKGGLRSFTSGSWHQEVNRGSLPSQCSARLTLRALPHLELR